MMHGQKNIILPPLVA